MSKIVIIGGGIIGQFCAYYLAGNGNQVSVIDDNPDMTPASEGNCGLVTPSHIVPLNSMQAVFQGIKWLGKKDAPLKIKPQLDRRFILWFLNFIRFSSGSAIEKATAARHELLQLSFSLYERFFEDEPTESEWNKGGLLYVCRNKKSMNHYDEEIALHKKFNLQSRMLSATEVTEEEPLLKGTFAGGALMEMDSWLNPTQLLKDLRRINEINGVKYCPEKVRDFRLSNGKINAAMTEKGEYIADEFILATGASSPLLAAKIGINLAVIPGKGYNLTTRNGEHIPMKRPLYMVEKKVVATPWKNGFRIGSTMEFSGYDLELNGDRLNALKKAAGEYLEIDVDSFAFTPWAGWRPMKDNGIPIIERNEKIKNLVIATGHSMVGLSMAPATGYMVNELITGKKRD
ncbi:MAG: FAD-dependent oxidoreductase [Cyclobacteriaceae bacterium]